jgi:chromosome segregation ATPase
MTNNKNEEKKIGDKSVKEMEQKLKNINQHVDTFQHKLEKLPSDIGEEARNMYQDLKDKRDKLETRLEQIKGSTDSALGDLQVGVKMAWEDLNIAYESAKERFATDSK